MPAFASVEDFATHIRVTSGDPPGELSAADAATVSQLLDMATAVIQNYTGQTISQVVNDVVTLDARGSDLLYLPQIPVSAVASVVLDGATLTNVTDYYWRGSSGFLYRANQPTTGWGTVPRSVVVTYTHGYATIPATVKFVCLELASRLFAVPGSGISSESAGNASTSYRDEPASMLLESEKRLLDEFAPWAMA